MKTANRFGLLLVITTLTALSAAQVIVAKGTGYGTTGVYARTFGAVIRNQGGLIQYVPDAVQGDSFVIGYNGPYAVSYTDENPNTDVAGISLNLSSASRFSKSWGTARELCAFKVSNSVQSCSVTVRLSVGDVLRAHSNTGGHPPNAQAVARFSVTGPLL
jgi:hypothetical protein